MVKDFPNVRYLGKGNGQAQPSCPSSKDPEGTISMHSSLRVNKRTLPTL